MNQCPSSEGRTFHLLSSCIRVSILLSFYFSYSKGFNNSAQERSRCRETSRGDGWGSWPLFHEIKVIYFVNAMIDRGFLGLLISRHKRLKTEVGKWGGGGVGMFRCTIVLWNIIGNSFRMGRALWLKFLKESMKLTVVLQGLWAEGRLNVVQWEHKLLFGGTISNSGDGRENVTCTFQVKLCWDYATQFVKYSLGEFPYKVLKENEEFAVVWFSSSIRTIKRRTVLFRIFNFALQ